MAKCQSPYCRVCRDTDPPKNPFSSPLWVPPGVTHDSVTPLLRMPETGRFATAYSFTFRYRGVEETVVIPSDGATSVEQIEDMAAAAAERFGKKVDERIQEKQGKTPATGSRMKDVAAVLRDIRTHGRKRAASSSGKLYFPSIRGMGVPDL